MEKEKQVYCKLAENLNYGTAIRKGASGKHYILTTHGWREMPESDARSLQDKNSDQYEPHLIISRTKK